MMLVRNNNYNLSATVVGYHGRSNYGDDIFRDVVMSLLSSYCGVSRYYFVCGAGAERPRNTELLRRVSFLINPIKGFARLRWLLFVYAGLRSDLLVFAAGSIFTDQRFSSISRALRLIRFLKRRDVPVIALGVSLGPFVSAHAETDCAQLLCQFDLIITRDSVFNKELVSSCPGKLIESIDLAMIGHLPLRSNTGDSQLDQKNSIVVSVTGRAFVGPEGARNLNEIANALLNRLDQLAGCDVVLLVACADLKDGDLLLTKELEGKLARHSSRVKLFVHSQNDLEDTTQVIMNASLVIASRLHVSIMALKIGIPVLSIAYARKTIDFYVSNGIDSRWLIKHTDDCAPLINEFLCVDESNLHHSGSVLSVSCTESRAYSDALTEVSRVLRKSIRTDH